MEPRDVEVCVLHQLWTEHPICEDTVMRVYGDCSDMVTVMMVTVWYGDCSDMVTVVIWWL